MDMTHEDWSSRQLRGRALPRDIKVAIDYMRENLGQRIRMADIVAATGTPERTLRKHFLTFFGLAPLRFLQRLRLSAVRDALLATSSGSITELAGRFGFAHFGRFSRDYRSCFGELPSGTRRREAAPDQAGVLEARLTLPAPSLSATRPSLVIVPFQTPGDRESNWFAEGLAELLAAELACGPSLSVRLGPPVRAATVPRLGARYCLMGRVVRAIGRMRVIVRLIDVAEDRHLWGDSFDGDGRDALTLQDLVVRGVLREVRPRILGEQMERTWHVDPAALTGFELALRALPLALSPNLSGSINSSEDAVELLDQAMTLAPDCGLAVALSGWCHARRAYLPWSTQATEERAKADQMAGRAGILAPADALVLAIRASIAHLAGDYEAAESLATRAVVIDPTCAWGWDRLGWVHEATDRPNDALPFFARAERFPTPYLDKAASLDGVGTAYFTVGRYEEAAIVLRAAALIRPGSTGLHGKLAACYAQLRDKPAAWAELAKLRGILPDVSASQYVNGYPCSLGPFKDVLANSLTNIGMRA
jgi:TolB-like protein